MGERELRFVSGISHDLMRWALGQDPVRDAFAEQRFCRAVVLENGEHLAAVLATDLAGPGTTLFVPGEDAVPAGGPVVVGYGGSLGEPGAELSLNDEFYLQTQAYGVSEYISVLGPTVVRIAEFGDFPAYLADADRARAEGVFADFLTYPVIQLADLSALGAGPLQDGPRTRLYVAADGGVSTAPGGRRIGEPGDGLDRLEAAWAAINAESDQPCAVCLGAVVDEAERSCALASRPWLGRYLAAVAGIRDLRARGCFDVRVSGFGDRLLPALAEVLSPADATSAALPLLLWTRDAAYVTGERTFKLDLDAGKLAEALLVTGSVDAAAEHATSSLGLTEEAAREALHLVNGACLTTEPAGAR